MLLSYGFIVCDAQGQAVNTVILLPGSHTSVATQLLLLDDTIYLNTTRWDMGSDLIRRGFVKVSEEGGVLFEKDYGFDDRDIYPGQKSMLYADGFLLLSSVSQDSQDVVRSHLYKCTLAGDTVWTREYGSSSAFLSISSVILHPDGGFALLGIVKEQNFNESNIFMLRTDSTGNELWRKVYGYPGVSEEANVTFVHVEDEVYLMGGGEQVPAPNKPTAPYYYYRTFFLKLKADGTFERKNLSRLNQTEKIPSGIIRTQDDNYVYGSNSNDVSIPYNDQSKGLAVKIDADGNILWEKEIGSYGTFNSFSSVRERPNGDLVFAGRCSRGLSAGLEDGWVVNLTADGELISQTVFTWPGQSPNALLMNLNDIQLLPDGRVTGCGQVIAGQQRIWFFVSDDNGCFDQYCTYLGEPVNETLEGFAVYPNPAHDFVYIYNPYVQGNLTGDLLNLEGRTVRTGIRLAGESTNAVWVNDLPAGLYMLRVALPGGGMFTEKIIKQ